MKKALHIFAVNGKSNSGDFFLGPSTKYEFEHIVGEKVDWTNFDVRKKITQKDIDFINKFDYTIIGGGGLFLPDTNPNMTSCWQWACPTELINKITTKIYVISVGWNHFYGQDITMPNRNNNTKVLERYGIFKQNVEALINNSTLFTMRHRGDAERLKEIVDPAYHDKVDFSFCPVVKYVRDNYSKDFKSGDHITFEIKDDRPNRRYIKKSRTAFYNELLTLIKLLISEGEKIAVMSHDGSRTFANFLYQNKIPFLFIDNTVANKEKIISNYSKVKRLYCTAGHSQMTAFALGLDFISLITHDKLRYFLEDNNMFSSENYYLINQQNIMNI